MKVSLPYDLKDISPDRMANRRAGNYLVERQAFAGDIICALSMALDSLPEVRAFGIADSVLFGDDEYDDMRPY